MSPTLKRLGLVVLALGLGATALMLIHSSPTPAAPTKPPPAVGGPLFEVVRIDDDLQLTPGADPMPSGLSTDIETVGGTQHLYFKLVVPEGMTNPEARNRGSEWVNTHVQLPSDDAVVWGVPTEPGGPLRSYWLRGSAFIGYADIEAGSAAIENGTAVVHLKLSPAAAARLRSVTHGSLGGRLAFLLDGVVVAAPLIATENANGDLALPLRAGATLDNAKALAAAIARTPAATP